MRLYDQIRAALDPDEQAGYFRQILAISKQEFYAIGVARETQKYFIASNDFRNIPNPMIQSPSIYPTVGVLHPEQFFLAKS
jgi:peptide/nickel transport system substrate-binding protein